MQASYMLGHSRAMLDDILWPVSSQDRLLSDANALIYNTYFAPATTLGQSAVRLSSVGNTVPETSTLGWNLQYYRGWRGVELTVPSLATLAGSNLPIAQMQMARLAAAEEYPKGYRCDGEPCIPWSEIDGGTCANGTQVIRVALIEIEASSATELIQWLPFLALAVRCDVLSISAPNGHATAHEWVPAIDRLIAKQMSMRLVFQLGHQLVWESTETFQQPVGYGHCSSQSAKLQSGGCLLSTVQVEKALEASRKKAPCTFSCNGVCFFPISMSAIDERIKPSAPRKTSKLASIVPGSPATYKFQCKQLAVCTAQTEQV